MVLGMTLSLVSGTTMVMAAEMSAMVPKIRVGMMGLMSARAATVVEAIPPI